MGAGGYHRRPRRSAPPPGDPSSDMLATSMAEKDGWLSRHLKQDGSLVATMLAFGLSSLVILAAATVHLDLENDSLFALAVVGIPIAGLPGPIALILRLVRGGRGKAARCEVCGARPAAEVRYLQVTGVVVI